MQKAGKVGGLLQDKRERWGWEMEGDGKSLNGGQTRVQCLERKRRAACKWGQKGLYLLGKRESL